MSRWGAKRPQVFSFAAKIVGAAARPIATQGRSYKGQCWLEEISKTVAPRRIQRLFKPFAKRSPPSWINATSATSMAITVSMIWLSKRW